MLQLSPDAQVATYKSIVEMENRGHQLDDLFVRLKQAMIENAGAVSLPDAVGALDELRWHIQQFQDQATKLESKLGIQRRAIKRPDAIKRSDVNQLRGSTRTLKLPDLVRVLGTQQKTGTLRIKSRHGEQFILELLEGAVVHVVCDSPLPSQMLGNILVAQNKLSSEKLREFLARYSPETNGRFGQALAQSQIVDRSDLLDAIETQCRQLFQRIFDLDDAIFCFTDGPVSELELRVTLNTTHLLNAAAGSEEADAETESLADHPNDDPTVSADAPVVDDVPVLSELEVIHEVAEEPVAQSPAEQFADDTAATPAEQVDVAGNRLHAEALVRMLGVRKNPARELIVRDLNSVEILRATPDATLLDVPGIGRKTLAFIRQALAKQG